MPTDLVTPLGNEAKTLLAWRVTCPESIPASFIAQTLTAEVFLALERKEPALYISLHSANAPDALQLWLNKHLTQAAAPADPAAYALGPFVLLLSKPALSSANPALNGQNGKIRKLEPETLKLSQNRNGNNNGKNSHQNDALPASDAPRYWDATLIPLEGVANRTNPANQADHEAPKLVQKGERPETLLIHELRSPLMAQKYLLEWILKQKTSYLNKLAEPLDKVLGTTTDMLRLIQKLLQMNHLQNGFTPQPETLTTVKIPALLNDLAQTLGAMAASRKVPLQIDLPAKLPALKTDELLAKDLLLNLLENAIEHSPPGRQVLVKAALSETRLSILIANVGPALAPYYQTVLQTPDLDAVALLRPNAGGQLGKGLGLSIGMRLAGLLGGQLQYERCSLPEFGEPVNCFLCHLPRLEVK